MPRRAVRLDFDQKIAVRRAKRGHARAVQESPGLVVRMLPAQNVYRRRVDLVIHG
jgi:hypothetical protein